MAYVAFTVENALKINGFGIEWLSIEQWREAIQSSGYMESGIYMSLAKKKVNNGHRMEKRGMGAAP